MYDPLTHKTLAADQAYPDSYWYGSVTQTPERQPLQGDIDTETVIVGGGYAGLSCAWHLASHYQAPPVVLEANNIGWGCSGRNAGFVLPLSGRLGYEALVKKFGLDSAMKIHHEFMSGVSLVEQMIEASGADVERQPNGYLKIAHRPKYFDQLKRQADFMSANFGYQVSQLSKAELTADYVDHHEAHGALRYEQGYGIHPLKLCMAYHQLATDAGAQVYGNTPVQNIQKQGGKHVLTTPGGTVTAKNLVLCTNGYTPGIFHPALDSKTLPVLTSVIVTRPLTDEELKASGFQTNQVMMDTRQLKYYYRKLPDNRILFGGRGAITGKHADNPIYSERLLKALKRSFPALKHLTIDYRWSGWISVALDDIPHIHQSDDRVFYSAGYCGAGLSFSAQAGKRLAQKVVGDSNDHTIPMLVKPLPTFPLSPFRRVGQSLFYEIGRVRDLWF